MTKGEDEVLFLRLDLAKNIGKQCHLSEAGVNSIDGKAEQHLKAVLQNVILNSAISKLRSKQGTWHDHQ